MFAALGLGLIAAFGALVGLAAYAFAADVVGETFRRGWPAVALDVVTGVVLFLFGVTLVRRSAILARGSALHGT